MSAPPQATVSPPACGEQIVPWFLAETEKLFGPDYSQCLTRWIDAGHDSIRRASERETAVHVLFRKGWTWKQSVAIVDSHTRFARAAADFRIGEHARATSGGGQG